MVSQDHEEAKDNGAEIHEVRRVNQRSAGSVVPQGIFSWSGRNRCG